MPIDFIMTERCVIRARGRWRYERRQVSLKTGAKRTVSTTMPAATAVTPCSTIARPFARTIDVETPEPCALMGSACNPRLRATTRTRRYERRSPRDFTFAVNFAATVGGRRLVRWPIAFRMDGAMKRMNDTMHDTGLPGNPK